MTPLIPRSPGRNRLPTPTPRRQLLRIAIAAGAVAIVCASAYAAFLLHFNLSTVGSIELLLVVLVALRFGFLQGTIASLVAVLAMNYLFIPPVFKLTVADPQNWIALLTFETSSLLVSGLSSRARRSARDAEEERLRSLKLYELSRAILLIDSRSSATEQLSPLIEELIVVERAEFRALTPDIPAEDLDVPATRTSHRVLRLGTTPIGYLSLHGWETDPLLADAVASLSAVAIERARAIERETHAEAERNTERLRASVLDALAHGFKTPLTAIQTASSGLLAIDHLDRTQTELVSIIDEEAMRLSLLTTQLLQTAALESKEVRLRRESVALLQLIEQAVATQDPGIRARIEIQAPPAPRPDEVDAALIRQALTQLVDNAAKYSDPDAPIVLTLAQSATESTLTVRSVGRPVDPAERDRIFERFHRGATALHGPSGTGLGLSIVRKIAEAHGGRAWVECAGNTSSFRFTVGHHGKMKHG